MTIRLKPSLSPSPSPLFSWENVQSTPLHQEPLSTPQSPPTQWLSARDMKIFGPEPMRAHTGISECKDCKKPVLNSAMGEHADNCAKIRGGGKKGAKGKADGESSKKRKAEDDDPNPEDPSAPKKKKPATKVTKGRFKGPVDYDKQCGVINDKGLPCSRSLTCKSHSMGAKRAVQGRSKPYDELLLEWNRLNNPNFIEPVKRESKAERKERKEKEKAEKKKLAMQVAAANGELAKKSSGAGTGGPGTKKSKKTAAATQVAGTATVTPGATAAVGDDHNENLDEIDSEAEVDTLIHAVQVAQDKGIVGIPLAVPGDASSWFVIKRERLRNCRDLLTNALMPPPRSAAPGVVSSTTRLA